MKLLVIFAAALLGVQAVRVPYIVTDADGEKYQILLPQNRQGPVYNRPAFEYKPNDYEVYLSPLDHEEVNLQRGVNLGSGRPVYDYSAEDYHWPPYRQDVVSAARRRADSAKQSDSDSSDEEDQSKQEGRDNAGSEQQYGSGSKENETDDDEYKLILPHALQGQVHVPGLGLINPSAVKKVKVKVPHYADAFLRQQIIEQYLAAQGLNPQGFDVRGLIARGLDAEASRERGWDLQYSYNQQPKARKFSRPINFQQLMYVTVPERKRRQAVEVSTTTNPIKTTTVPDVIETNTDAEATTLTELAEGVTVTTDTPLAVMTTAPNAVPSVVTPFISVTTSKPFELSSPEPEPIIPLISFGSILPAEVSHVPFASRIPRSPTAGTGSTADPVLDEILSRNKPKVKGMAQYLIATTLSTVLAHSDERGPNTFDLSHTREMRAVNVAPVTPAVTEVNAVVEEMRPETTEVNCDIQCTKLDLNPVCAFNGECYHEFANQCAMETFICKRPDLGFKATPRERCVMHWLKRCNSQELKIE